MANHVAPSIHLAHAASPVTPRDRILRIESVENLVGLRKSTIYNMIKRCEFPAPLRIGPRLSGWSEAAIYQWIQERIKEGSTK